MMVGVALVKFSTVTETCPTRATCSKAGQHAQIAETQWRFFMQGNWQ